MGEQKPDFSGWATKNNLECSDGRTILAGAFAHQDKMRVPLVWQHDHDDPSNVLGHAILENRAFGVFTQGYFNKTSRAKDAKEAVEHGDINALSIFANKLKQRGGNVHHGNIIEVSLVMAGANPGAFITDIHLAHGANGEEYADEAIIYTGLTLEHSDNSDNSDEGDTMADGADTQEKTVKEIFDELTEEQKNVVYYMIGEAVNEADGGDDNDEADDVEHSITTEEFLAHLDQSIQEGIENMGRNTFAQFGNAGAETGTRLSHAQFADIVKQARADKVDSLKHALIDGANNVLAHAVDGAGNEYGIDQIEMLFPDAKALSTTPEFISRRMEWVNEVLSKTKHTPFAKVKTVHADITEPEARAKGYIKGKRKKEEVFSLLKRTTGPTTIYKKQKIDRDDELDITDFDVVVWLQQEMRLMLEEEIARAILVGDGRSALSDDKVKDPAGAPSGDGIRSIFKDDELFASRVALAANVSPKDMVKGIIRSRVNYKGSGKPTLFISDNALTDIMLEEDKIGRALYETEEQLAAKLRVANIVGVEIFDEYEGLLAIMVNLQDYSVGTNKGGEITNFQDFDIDFNQRKLLQETRLSGALTKALSAVVVTRETGTSVVPTAPSFDGPTNTITIPSTTGIDYYVDDEVKTAGAVVITADAEVVARPKSGYFIPANTTRAWSFAYTAG